MWNNPHTKPEPGRNIVVLYMDGGGALVYRWNGANLLDTENEPFDWNDLIDRQLWDWAYLPDGCKLWGEA